MELVASRTIRRSTLEIMCAVASYENLPAELWAELQPSFHRLLRLTAAQETTTPPERQRAEEITALLTRNGVLLQDLRNARKELEHSNQRILHMDRVAASQNGPEAEEPVTPAVIVRRASEPPLFIERPEYAQARDDLASVLRDDRWKQIADRYGCDRVLIERWAQSEYAMPRTIPGFVATLCQESYNTIEESK